MRALPFPVRAYRAVFWPVSARPVLEKEREIRGVLLQCFCPAWLRLLLSPGNSLESQDWRLRRTRPIAILELFAQPSTSLRLQAGLGVATERPFESTR